MLLRMCLMCPRIGTNAAMDIAYYASTHTHTHTHTHTPQGTETAGSEGNPNNISLDSGYSWSPNALAASRSPQTAHANVAGSGGGGGGHALGGAADPRTWSTRKLKGVMRQVLNIKNKNKTDHLTTRGKKNSSASGAELFELLYCVTEHIE